MLPTGSMSYGIMILNLVILIVFREFIGENTSKGDKNDLIPLLNNTFLLI